MNIAKSLIQLFISLFRCLLFYLDKKYPGFTKTYLLMLENQTLKRTVEKNNLQYDFDPCEKQAVHECFSILKNAGRFFTLVSPRTVLRRWNNAIADFWSRKRGKPGRPPVSKETKELILKLKQENFLWGARRREPKDYVKN